MNKHNYLEQIKAVFVIFNETLTATTEGVVLSYTYLSQLNQTIKVYTENKNLILDSLIIHGHTTNELNQVRRIKEGLLIKEDEQEHGFFRFKVPITMEQMPIILEFHEFIGFSKKT